ncbi:MAG: DUF4198 domain-containing protein [Pseudohongiella sp.]|uniref:DUF4198 domain-containing protein n=1 Tax=Pseudohongiella sp. TaxID=1979412 RepID=UPI0034A0461E
MKTRNSRTTIRLLTIGSLLLALPIAAQAHRAWILPAATIHSSEDPWVTVDAAISNDIFHTDYRPMQLNGIKAIGPDGMAVELQNGHTGKYRSTFDINLTQRGTYKIFTASNGMTARWLDEDGQRQSWPPRGAQPNEADFAANVPADAQDLVVTRSSRRQETFITAGVPSDEVLEPEGQGFEMEPITHPNDLYAGETAEFRFLIDGEPAVGAEIIVLAGGMRYRNHQDEISVTTNADGIAEITWPDAGMYWLEASYEDDRAAPPATSRRGGYVATFEVMPE